MNLEEIGKRVAACKECPLHKDITHHVPGEGSDRARVFFIGEGPGEEEDKQGRPFVGRSGKFLREMITLIGLTPEQYFIGNVVKCRPPNNRDPRPEEIEACFPWLTLQLETIKPQVIATLGRHSMGKFLSGLTISKCHGRIYRRRDGVFIMPLYHPAVALYSPAQRKILMDDMKKLPFLLAYIDQKTPLDTGVTP